MPLILEGVVVEALWAFCSVYLKQEGQHRTGSDVNPCDPVACVRAVTVVTFPFSFFLSLSPGSGSCPDLSALMAGQGRADLLSVR